MSATRVVNQRRKTLADKWQATAPRSLSDSRERLVEHSTICGMTDDDVDRAAPLSAKAVTALLPEARSLSRRADKLGGAAAAVDHTETHQLAGRPAPVWSSSCTTQLLERQLMRGEKEQVGAGSGPPPGRSCALVAVSGLAGCLVICR